MKLLYGYVVRLLLEFGLKEDCVRLFVVQVEVENVFFVKGLWNMVFVCEVCVFLFGKYKD